PSGGKPRAVGVERDVGDILEMASEDRPRRPVGRLSESYDPLLRRGAGSWRGGGEVLSGGGEPPAVGAEREAGVPDSGSGGDPDRLRPPGRIPDLHHAVFAARRQTKAIRAEDQARHPGRMAVQGAQLPIGRGVPDPDALVEPPRGEELA